MKNTKKGFTLVELLIVIAIIAILATVSIIGYTSFIDKANQSADQQGVTQMNTVLNAAQVSEKLVVDGNDAATAINIFNVLIENGYNDELVAYYEKYSFGYVVEDSKAVIVLVEDGKVAYPEEHADKSYKEFFKSVDNADELLEAFDTGYVLLKTDAVFTEAIGISNDVTIVGNNKILNDDRMTDDRGANSAININGAQNPITVNMSGLSIQNPDDRYARGLNFSANTGNVTVVLDNVDIMSHYYTINTTSSNTAEIEILIKNSTISGWAALNVWSKVNVTFENCTIIGEARSDESFGTIVMNTGSAGSTVTFKNCTIEANNVSADSGMMHVRSDVDAAFTFEGCTFKVNGEVVEDLRVEKTEGTTITVK